MPIVFDKTRLPAEGDPLPFAGARVDVYLVASATDSAAPGWETGFDQSFMDKYTQYTDSTGYVEFDLWPNASILPANTYYVWVTHLTDGRVNRRSIRVPAPAGPYSVNDLLIAAPNPMQAAFGPSTATVRRTTAQSIPNNTGTNVIFEAAVYQNGDTPQWSAGAPTKLIAPVDGEYIFGGYARWISNATGIRSTALVVSGSFVVGYDERVAASGSVNPTGTVSGFYFLPAGSYIEMRVYQNSGGALSIDDAGFDDSIRMWMKRVG